MGTFGSNIESERRWESWSGEGAGVGRAEQKGTREKEEGLGGRGMGMGTVGPSLPPAQSCGGRSNKSGPRASHFSIGATGFNISTPSREPMSAYRLPIDWCLSVAHSAGTRRFGDPSAGATDFNKSIFGAPIPTSS